MVLYGTGRPLSDRMN